MMDRQCTGAEPAVLRKLFAAIIFLLLLGVGNVWADSSYTLGWGSATGASGTYTNFTDVSGSVTDICSFSTAKNGANAAPAYNSGNSELERSNHYGFYNNSGF